MNQNSPDDAIDRLFSSFLKGQMRHPWPAAPATPAASEPSTLAASRSTAPEAPRNQPAASRDTGSKARYTLAASFALLLGTCWTLSNGFQPAARTGGGTAPQPVTVNMNATGAADPDAVKELKKTDALNGNENKKFVPPKIDLP